MENRVHIVGAGLAGLACAVRLASAGVAVTLHEAAGHAGGRCRSYHDPVLDREIDNGNHLILSGNRSMRAYLADCGAADELGGPPRAVVPFLDLKTGERWTIRPNAGRLPWWLCAPSRRAPDGGLLAHLSGLMRLRKAGEGDTVAGVLGGNPLYARFWRPLAVSILNTPGAEASAALLRRTMEESLALGGAACRPLFPRHGLSRCFVDPALATLERLGAEIRFNARLRSIERDGARAVALSFADGERRLGGGDRVVLAVPPDAAARLLPDLPALAEPWDFHPILNAHFRLDRPVELPGGLPETAFPGRHRRRVGGVDLRPRRRAVGHAQRGGGPGRRGRRGHRAGHLARGAGGPWPRRHAPAALPHRQGTARHHRPDPGPGRPPPGRHRARRQHPAGRRLDRHRPALHHRRRHPLRPRGGGQMPDARYQGSENASIVSPA